MVAPPKTNPSAKSQVAEKSAIIFPPLVAAASSSVFRLLHRVSVACTGVTSPIDPPANPAIAK